MTTLVGILVAIMRTTASLVNNIYVSDSLSLYMCVCGYSYSYVDLCIQSFVYVFFAYMVVDIMVPFGVSIIIRHLYLGYPKRNQDFDNHQCVYICLHHVLGPRVGPCSLSLGFGFPYNPF